MKFYRQFDQTYFRFSNYQAAIIGLSISSITLLGMRILLTGTHAGSFMIWNLFLAVLPFAMTYFLRSNFSSPKTFSRLNRITQLFLVACALGWLLLLPNAPYMMTDLIHITNTAPVLRFYDICMYGSFGVLGVLLFTHSLNTFGSIFCSVFEISRGRILLIIESSIIFASSLGVYLGRDLRWNSWNLITSPMCILRNIFSIFLNPSLHVYAWLCIIPMFLFLFVIHLALNYRAKF
jgi:uncharacterized membrane protein